MPWTNAWDETQPLGSAFASTIDDIVRQLKLDLRERLNSQHVFGQNTTDDGVHRNISIPNTYAAANLELFKAAGGVISGSSALSFLDLSGSWNTSGTPSAVKVDVTDTASGVGSLLLDLRIAGTPVFQVNKSGDVKIHSVPYVWPSTQGATNTWLKNDGSGNLSWAPAPGLNVTGTKTSAYAAISGDFVLCNGTFSVTLPTAVANAIVSVKNLGTGTITVNTTGGQTIDGAASLQLVTQYESYDFIADASAWYVK